MTIPDRRPGANVIPEGLALELKAWLDPVRPEHKALIVRTLIALRNHGGGALLVGYTNNGLPRSDPPDFDIEAAYHIDALQDLVTRYASERFEISVSLEEFDGHNHPRIDVPGGVRTPVRTKAEIAVNRDGLPHVLLAAGEVPIRTLESNGRASTAEAGAADWERLMQTCFDNREADVGRFIRRHLGGVAPAIAELISTVKAMPSADPDLRLLDFGRERFELSLAEHDKGGEGKEMHSWGGREVALVICPSPEGFKPNGDFLRRMLASTPRLTSYPPWLDTAAAGANSQPEVRDGRWEALLCGRDLFDALSFELFDPQGQFYERRLLLLDVIARRNGVQPRQFLGERQTLTDVTEALVTGLAFASAMNVADDQHSLQWAFRWSGLRGRHVDEWFARGPSRYVAADDISPICRSSFPADTPPTALASVIEELMAPMFSMFRGYQEPRTQIEETLAEVIERRSKF